MLSEFQAHGGSSTWKKVLPLGSRPSVKVQFDGIGRSTRGVAKGVGGGRTSLTDDHCWVSH